MSPARRGDTAHAVSQENVELVKTGYAAFVRGDLAGVIAVLDPEVEMADPFGFSTTDAYHGHDGFLQTVQDSFDAFEHYEIEPHEFLDAGDNVIVSVRLSGVGRGSGVAVDMPLFHVWTLRAGKAVQGRTFKTKEAALQAVGLAPR